MTSDYDEQQEARTPQHQPRQPGIQAEMEPQPVTVPEHYVGSGKLEGRAALLVGGDSGIGRAVSVLFAKEGADVAFVYLDEHGDAAEAHRLVEQRGRRCVTIAGDIGHEEFCRGLVQQTVGDFGRLDILVNNAAEQHPQESIEDISAEQLERTFRTNIYSNIRLLCRSDATARIRDMRWLPVAA